MNSANDDALRPLAAADGEPAFDEPWQAQVLAVADSLVQSGLFSAGAWSAALGAELKRADEEGAVDNQETYYRCALNALEALVAENSEIDRKAMQGKSDDWERAYLSTPHGQPVELPAE